MLLPRSAVLVLLTSLSALSFHLSAVFAATPQEQLQAPRPSDAIPSTCPVTRPSDHPFRPPAPYPSAGGLWIGNEKLWTYMPGNGIWSGLPHYTPEDPRLRQKLFWWHQGYDSRKENPPELIVRGKRLDAFAPPIETDEHANNAGISGAVAMVVGIFIPTVGCWEITGEYHGEQLSYVVWVTAPQPFVDSTQCSPNELLARMRPDDPAYVDAMELARTLQTHGVVVKCVLQSKMANLFDDQKGAAFFKTEYGQFEALFLPKPLTFDSMEIASRAENGRLLYSFEGTPRQRSVHPIDSNHQIFFEKHGSILFVTSNSPLPASIAKALSLPYSASSFYAALQSL